MKKIAKFSFAALTVLAAVSCSKEFGSIESDYQQQVPSGCKAVTFNVTLDEISTKAASLGSDLKVTWEVGDSVAVIDTATAAFYGFRVVSAQGISAVISGVVADTTNGIFAVYPKDAATTFSIARDKDGKVTSKTFAVTVPTIQTIPAGKNIDGNALVSVAKANVGEALSFKNVVSLMKFKVSKAGCTSVSFSGNNSEAFTGVCTESEEAFAAAYKNLTVKVDGGFAASTDYYAAVCPVTFTTGFAAGVICSDGVVIKKGTGSASFVRNGGLVIGDLIAGSATPLTEISTKAELAQWAENASSYPQGANVKLTADIDWDGEWTAVRYCGNLDGGNHSIYGSTNGLTFKSDADGRIGLFSEFCGNEVKNLKLGYNPDNQGYDGHSKISFEKLVTNAGPLAGKVSSSDVYSPAVIDNVDNYIPVTFLFTAATNKPLYVGGIVGDFCRDGSVLKNCENFGAISSPATTNTAFYKGEYIGGMIGLIDCVNMTVQDCDNNGKISPVAKKPTTSANFYGGIAGRMATGATGIKILRCKNLCTETVAFTGQIAQQRFYGGIIGCAHDRVSSQEGAYDLVIEDCVNLSSCSYGNLSKNISAAGIVGMVNDYYLIKNCRNGQEGTAYGKMFHGNDNVNEISAVAGIIGYINPKAAGTIETCTNYGTMDFGLTSKGTYSGAAGILGVACEGSYADILDCTNYGSVRHGSNAAGSLTGAGAIIGANVSNCTISRCNNYGDITAEGTNVLSAAGGLVGYQAAVEGGLQTAAGCQVNCKVSSANAGGMIVGNNLGTSTWGTADSKIKVKGSFNSVVLDASTFSSKLSGGKGAATCNAEYWN